MALISAPEPVLSAFVCRSGGGPTRDARRGTWAKDVNLGWGPVFCGRAWGGWVKPVRRISAVDGVDVGVGVGVDVGVDVDVGVGVDVGVDVGVEEAICSWVIDEATSSRRLAGLKKDSPVGKSTVYHMLAWIRWDSLGSAPGGPGTRLGLRAYIYTPAYAYTYTRTYIYTRTCTHTQVHVCAPHPNAVRADHVAHWATRTHGIEGPARHQGKSKVGGRRLLGRASEGLPIESRSRRGRCPRDLAETQAIPARIGDIEGGNAVGHGDAVRAFDLDAVAAAQPGQRAEVGIAMAADHGGARVTGKNARRVVPGAERQAAP